MWVDPDVMSAGTKTSYGSFPASQDTSIRRSSRQAERGPLLPSHHMEQEEEEEEEAEAAEQGQDVHYPHWPSATPQGQQRRLRWCVRACVA